jgi:hypothetical protein
MTTATLKDSARLGHRGKMSREHKRESTPRLLWDENLRTVLALTRSDGYRNSVWWYHPNVAFRI